jgi:OTU domain-containing protein 6
VTKMRRTEEMEKQRQIAADEALNMPDLASQENASMRALFGHYSLQEEAVRPDGNCLYTAFALQLNRTGLNKVSEWAYCVLTDQFDVKSLRTAAASFIRRNKSDFEPFLYSDDHSAAKDIDSYCKEIEDSPLWGGELEITALSRSLGVPVEIYSTRSNRPLVIENGDEMKSGIIRLAYYQHMYGLGHHYNALSKV